MSIALTQQYKELKNTIENLYEEVYQLRAEIQKLKDSLEKRRPGRPAKVREEC